MGAYGAEEGAERATEWARAEQAVREKGKEKKGGLLGRQAGRARKGKEKGGVAAGWATSRLIRILGVGKEKEEWAGSWGWAEKEER